MIEYEYYDWNALIGIDQREKYISDIRRLIADGQYWKNSPRYQTDINVFALPGEEWTNLKMSFIWSVFAYLKKDVQIKSVKSWSYMTSLNYTVEDRNTYWHQHLREGSKVVSGVYYLHMPTGVDLNTAGTEFSPNGPETEQGRVFADARVGQWIIWPGSAWHRPGILQSSEDRFIVAADLEFV
jgi:hypothetical protein